MFGTFESGESKEEVAFGLIHNVQTYNPLYIQYFHYKYIWDEFCRMDTFANKLSVLFKGPGWRPGLFKIDLKFSNIY
jgi:alkylglycerol monooxygenase